MTLNRPMNTWHCVRCHGTYTRAENANADPESMKCTIPHIWGTPTLLPASTNLSSRESRYICQALCCPGVCRTEVRFPNGSKEVSGDISESHCFEGKHTTNPKQVGYNGISVKGCAKVHSS